MNEWYDMNENISSLAHSSWKASPLKRTALYVGITFLLTWSMWIGAGVATGAYAGGFDANPLMVVFVTLGMFIPTIGALITNAILGKEHRVCLNLKPHIKGNVKQYLLAWFLPTVLSVLSACLFFIVFSGWFDPSAPVFAAAAQPAIDAGELTQDLIMPLLGVQILLAVFLAPFINIIPALGEEIGWRGFMYPQLAQGLGARKGVLIAGLIWGLWHAPITAMGHNYGIDYLGFPFTGIAVMCVFCTSAGIVLAWLRERTQSVWSCALFHGALNAIAGIGVYFSTVGTTLWGPSPAGLVGGIPLIVCAVLCWRALPNGKQLEG